MALHVRLDDNFTIRENDSPDLLDVASKILVNRENAKRTNQRYANIAAEIDADPDLSDRGRANQHAENNENKKAAMKTLRDQETQIIRDAIAKLEVRLDGFRGFGPENLIVFRDAQDRAEAITTADRANEVMTRALRNNDHTLASAVFRKAHRNNWTEAVRAFQAARPSEAQVANDLDKLRTIRDQFGRGLNYFA
ncbi:hypothetical protein [Microbacterium sp. ZW T5_56]|uniref:hypothetical protein n=1 Tax=Microbacterium sp. ZW T5_56 TaxID=3378081 RepID=UPI0038538591